MLKNVLAAVMLLIGIIFSFAGIADAAQPTDNRLDFTILKNGKEVGVWHVKFRQVGANLKVSVRTKIHLSTLGFEYYNYKQESHETWKGDQLIGLTSFIVEDTTISKNEYRMILREKDGLLRGELDEQPIEASVDQVLSSLWDDRILLADHVMHTANGQKLAITVADAGVEVLDVLGQAVPTRHYQIRGQFNRDVWFDGNYILRRVRWQDGGNVMEYVPR